jgi:predicted GTPase
MKTELEKAAERLQKDKYGIFISKDADVKGQLVIDTARAAFLSGMTEGAKYQSERMYSEEEVLNIIVDCDGSLTQAKKWFEQFKKK